jgi:hypothetical protein
MDGFTEKMMKKSADMALEMTAKLFGMDSSTVAKILQVGIPMQKKMIAENAELAKEMYAKSFAMLPEQMQEFYRNLLNDPKLAEVGKDEYETMFGTMATSINEAAAKEANVTPDEAASVFGAMMPAFEMTAKEEAEEAGVEDEKGFAKIFG